MDRLGRMGWRTARRVAVGILGSSLVIVGLALLVLPGPGVVVLLVGLGFLSLEFAFAQRWLDALKARAANAADRAGVPPRHRWVFPAAGGVLMIVVPVLMGMVHVVHGSGTLRVVSKEHFGWSHTLVSVASLRSAAAAGDPQAASLLARLGLQPAAPAAAAAPRGSTEGGSDGAR